MAYGCRCRIKSIDLLRELVGPGADRSGLLRKDLLPKNVYGTDGGIDELFVDLFVDLLVLDLMMARLYLGG